MRRMILLFGARDFKADGSIQLPFKGRDVPMRGPEFQFRIPAGAKPGKVVLASWKQVNSLYCLRVASIEPLGEPDDRRQHAHRRAERAPEIAEPLVRLLRRSLPVVAGDEGDHFHFTGIESPQVPI